MPLILLIVAMFFMPTPASAQPTTSFTPRPWLGIAIPPTADGQASSGRALADARSLGMGFTEVSVPWDGLSHPADDLRRRVDGQRLVTANATYPAIDLPVMLCINPVDATRRRTPADLNDVAWDDPALLARFVALLDHVATQTPNLTLIGLSFGNDVDVLLADDADAWAAYTRFFVAARAHANTLWPNLPVGVKLTARGFLNGGEHAAALAAASDALMVNYTALTPASRVETPAAVRRTLARLLAATDGRPLWFTELGCPSGRACGSNEAAQAEFFKNFGRWRTPHAAQVPRVCVKWLNDLGDEAVDARTAGDVASTPALRAGLATVGVQRHDGSPKQAVREIRRWK